MLKVIKIFLLLSWICNWLPTQQQIRLKTNQGGDTVMIKIKNNEEAKTPARQRYGFRRCLMLKRIGRADSPAGVF
jgi:hypothetical protein